MKNILGGVSTCVVYSGIDILGDMSTMMMRTTMNDDDDNVLQLPGYRVAKRTRTAKAGSDAPSWQLHGTALKLLVTTYSTLKIAITIRSALMNVLCEHL